MKIYRYRSVYLGVKFEERHSNLIELARLLGIKSGRGATPGIGPLISRIADIPAPTLARILNPYINGGKEEA